MATRSASPQEIDTGDGTKSPLHVSNEVLTFKAAIKPVWTYSIHLWGSACATNSGSLNVFNPKQSSVSSPQHRGLHQTLLSINISTSHLKDRNIPSLPTLYRPPGSRSNPWAVTMLDEPANPPPQEATPGRQSTLRCKSKYFKF